MAMPEIKADVNKEPERDKKKAGLLARLFGGGGSGGFGGASGGFGSAAPRGGLLATKAGLLALILVGTTVAGGIGLVGYRVFGPGQDQGGGDNLQLFAPKPKADPNAAKAQGASSDGSSQSLDYLAKANSSPAGASNPSDAAPKDATAASAASDASGGGTGGAINKTDASSGNGVSKNLLKPGKFGALSGPGGSGGGSSAVASAAPAKPAAPDAAAQAHKGTLSNMGKGSAVAGGSSRAIASRRIGGAIGQAFGARSDNRGAVSSAAGGRTYDGSAATTGGNIGGGTPIGGPGAGPGGSAPQAKSMPNTAANNQPIQAPPTPTMQDAAPWQNAIKTAQVLLALGGIILYAMSKLSKAYAPLFLVMNAIVAVIAAAIIALGAQIAGGQYGQKLQGGVLAAAGAGLMVAAALAYSEGADASDGTTSQTTTNVTQTGSPTAPGGQNTVTTTTNPSAANSGPFGMNMYVLVGGGAALVGVAGTMMVPPQKYPSSTFNNGNPPDTHWFGYQELPSETALKKMIA